ncbi:MAG: DUF2723 domain-containing protein [candidate division Zixibacteria bacterium]|nr:DUF2723 domain-containing protein [candidate division Zixibacteria bacterium]
MLSVLFFSFTPALWSQAISNEVYALNFLLICLLLYLLAFQLNQRKQNLPCKSDKLFYLFFFLYGLSFGNHLSVLLLLPGFLFLFLVICRKSLFQGKRLILSFFLFILGISVYFYLPIRSSCNPVLNWGEPSSFSNFLRHVSGWQYRVWMFSESAQVLWDNFKNFLLLFNSQFNFYVLPLILTGLIILLRRNLKLFLLLLLIFLFTIFYGINYEIQDIDPYYLPSFLVATIWLGIGIFYIFELSYKKRQFLSSIGLVLLFVFSALPFLNLYRNYYKQNQSKNYFAYDYAENILRCVKKDPIILTRIWDHYSPWLYLRFIEGKRPDVRFMDTELLRRSWYLDYLKDNYTELSAKSEGEISQFRKQVYLFENNLPYDQSVIEKSYVDMIQSFLLKNYSEKPLYCDLLTDDKFLVPFIRLPEGIVLRLYETVAYYPYAFPDLELRGIIDPEIYKDGRSSFHVKNYPQAIKDRIIYLQYSKQEPLAQDLFGRYMTVLNYFFK